jgi:hypothetical protein
MKTLMTAIALMALVSAAIADPLAHQYAADIVRESIKIPEPDLEFSEWQQSVSGGYILRLDFDVDGDGAAERFFASSFNAENLVCEWTVFGGGSGKSLGNGASFRPDGFWWNPATREILDYVRYGAEGGLAIFTHFDKSGLTTRNEPATLDEVSAGLSIQKPPRKGFHRIKPDVTISLLADVVSNADSDWRQLILDDAGNNYSLPNGRLLLTEDMPRVDTLRNFTPDAAFAALQESETQSEQSSNKPPTAKNLPIVDPPPIQKTPEARPSTSSEEPASSTQWLLIALLLVAAIGMLWLLLKRRKSCGLKGPS